MKIKKWRVKYIKRCASIVYAETMNEAVAIVEEDPEVVHATGVREEDICEKTQEDEQETDEAAGS